ncbi:MAG TPA: hypothetical protein VIV60_33055 [Polyangiaceae bacterium]
MASLRSSALSNDPVAEEAATENLLGGGSAMSAALAGFFASAGAYSGVLLGPLSILVAGVGSGVRAFDGRLCQPGLGIKRPRGFRDAEPVPRAAYVAVPTNITAAAVALAYDDERSLGAVVKFGILRAERAGADARSALLQVVRGMGAAAFSDPAFVRPLLHVAGTSEGGLLTPTDLARVPGDIEQAAVPFPEEPGWFETPWAAEAAALPVRSDSICLVTFDSKGVAAGVAYERCRDAVSFDTMELDAPRAAVPVLRGVTRVGPGERLSSAANMAIRVEAGNALEIVASPNASRFDPQRLATPQLAIRRDPSTRQLTLTRR